ncbi:hypothetical protein [Bacillus thuringiensis]|uniref:hypothetical protein n=1 Tax=Bacillus thuringiensis TaxID=1428 RepID=UPI0021D6672F|nr:hypothetical protein [Bacillus thuringiensis]MCU7667595.1 hypothetical protein [Bacillus thuringiensis]
MRTWSRDGYIIKEKVLKDDISQFEIIENGKRTCIIEPTTIERKNEIIYDLDNGVDIKTEYFKTDKTKRSATYSKKEIEDFLNYNLGILPLKVVQYMSFLLEDVDFLEWKITKLEQEISELKNESLQNMR